MAIYMKLPCIAGESTTKGYEKWIKIDNLEFVGVSNGLRMAHGQPISFNRGSPKFGKILLTKPMDSSSLDLFEQARTGEIMKTVEIHYVASGEPPITYFKLELQGAAITHYRESHEAEGEHPREIINLIYSGITRTYIPRDAQNKLGNPRIKGYDLETASAT